MFTNNFFAHHPGKRKLRRAGAPLLGAHHTPAWQASHWHGHLRTAKKGSYYGRPRSHSEAAEGKGMIMWVWINTYYSNTIFRGMNIHKSQLFWCELQGYKVLTHCHVNILVNHVWCLFFAISWTNYMDLRVIAIRQSTSISTSRALNLV